MTPSLNYAEVSCAKHLVQNLNVDWKKTSFDPQMWRFFICNHIGVYRKRAMPKDFLAFKPFYQYCCYFAHGNVAIVSISSQQRNFSLTEMLVKISRRQLRLDVIYKMKHLISRNLPSHTSPCWPGMSLYVLTSPAGSCPACPSGPGSPSAAPGVGPRRRAAPCAGP